MSSEEKVVERMFKELAEATALHRFEATLLFGQQTVYLAALGGLLAAFFRNPSLDPVDQIILSFMGIGVTMAFAVIIHRGAQHLLLVIARAEELCADLKIELYARRVPPRAILTGLDAVKFFYLLGLLLWISLLVRSAWRL